MPWTDSWPAVDPDARCGSLEFSFFYKKKKKKKKKKIKKERKKEWGAFNKK
jgi:hypothetical protein